MQRSNFQAWYDEADIPRQDENGSWYDAETGHSFDSAVDYKSGGRAVRKHVSDKAQAARDTAKFFGGCALTGTTKQKEWAEKIRANKLATMSEEGATLACRKNGLGRTAKFWIENRERTGKEIAEFFVKQRDLLDLINAYRTSGDNDKHAIAAAAYNALTAAFVKESEWRYCTRR